MSNPRQLLSTLLLLVVMLCGLCQARKKKEQWPRNITHCDSGPSGVDGFDWNNFRGRWYVSRITTPLGNILRDVKGYAVDIEVSSVEPNAKDKAWRDATVDRKETLVKGDSRKCSKRSWRCRREQGNSVTVCVLNVDGRGTIMQKSLVMATDYITTAAVYRETYVNNQFLSKQINLMVRDPQADPDQGVVGHVLHDFCGLYAADVNSEFYKSIPNDSSRSCFLP